MGLPLFSAPGVPMAAPLSDLDSAGCGKPKIKATDKAISVRLIFMGGFLTE
jgi:hypothetical protein